MNITTLLDVTASAAATGDWKEVNQYADKPGITIYASVNSGAAGEMHLVGSPDQEIAVCLAPIGTGTTYQFIEGHFPYVRVSKGIGNGGKVLLVQSS